MGQQLEVFDVVVLVLLLGGLLMGAVRGFVWQLAWLVALVGSAVAAIRWGNYLAPLFGSTAPWNQFFAMFVIFLLTSLGIWLVFRAIREFIDRLKLQEFDRQLGALFGLLKGLAICVVLTFFGVTLTETTREWVLRSTSGRLLAKGIVWARSSLPPEVHSALKSYLDEFEAELDFHTSSEEASSQLPES
ncbi:MAG: CvpA family protein [Thermoguttaceae bacterium]|nr:CvpA family protein [Thermoguttaceae bacterium]MDW8078817.1 CvpA family protein [Thermoguttaceae bacterium]